MRFRGARPSSQAFFKGREVRLLDLQLSVVLKDIKTIRKQQTGGRQGARSKSCRTVTRYLVTSPRLNQKRS